MRHEIFSIPLDDISSSDLDRLLSDWVNGVQQKMITTPNPEFLLLSRKNEEFKNILKQSDLSLPDGVGLRYAVAALTDKTLSHRQTGVDLVGKILYIANTYRKKIVIVDGLNQSGEASKILFERKYPNAQIFVVNPGVVSFPISKSVQKEILERSPDILFVALGQGKQEKFIKELTQSIPSIKISVGVGGAFDMISGLKPRAPMFLRKTGLEWLWRVYVEPSRIGRISNAVFIFPLVVVWGTLKQRRFLKACRNVFPEIIDQLFRS
jgi:N-acetylglucosaminyldiphosphoundecaprenol N-acetyl-beta-D-mannosaminyltransferase